MTVSSRRWLPWQKAPLDIRAICCDMTDPLSTRVAAVVSAGSRKARMTRFVLGGEADAGIFSQGPPQQRAHPTALAETHAPLLDT